jgi:hypothetical protein
MALGHDVAAISTKQPGHKTGEECSCGFVIVRVTFKEARDFRKKR